MSTATLLKYTVVYQETRRDDALCHVHAVGCADLTRRAVNRDGIQVDELLDLDDLEKYMPVLDPDELGYDASSVTVHGCAEDVHKAAKASTGKRSPRGTAKPAPTPAPAAIKNVKLKRGTRVHAPGTNGLPVCRATGTAEKYEATGKEVSCTSCLKVLAPTPAETPATRPQRTKAGGIKAVPATPTRRVRDLDASDVEAEAETARAAETAAKPRTRSRKATTPDRTPQPASVVTSPAAEVASAIKNGRSARRTATSAPAKARRNGTAQDAAKAAAARVITEAVVRVVSANQGPEEWVASRLPKCTDENFELAVKVRELRVTGAAWWRIAHELGLPGSGPSVKQGKTGAAHARRAWERAWGKTYSDTSVPRETKATKKERALTHEPRPYFGADVEDAEILDLVSGKTITWFTRVGTNGGAVVSEQIAEVHSGSARVVLGPKGRVLEFHERIYEQTTGGSGVKTPMVGPQRSVYVDRIEKVGA